MNLYEKYLKYRTRRQFFSDCTVGVGSLALASLLNEQALRRRHRGAGRPHRPENAHSPAKAKSIIYLHMAGAAATLDLFDYKPKLIEINGRPCPDSYIRGQKFAFITAGKPKLLGSPHKFAKYGQSGQEISSIVPHLATVADDLCFIRSMHTDQFNHAPAQLFLHTGSPRSGRPGMGSG